MVEAIQESQTLMGGYPEEYAIPLVSNKTFYRLTLQNGEMGWVENAWMMNQRRLLTQTDMILLGHHDPRWMTRTGLPEEYFPVGNNILGLSPKPSSAEDILEIDMVVIPAPYTTDTYRVKLREEFIFGVVNYAVGEYFAGTGDAKRASDHYAIYAETVGLRKIYPAANEQILTSDTTKMIDETRRVRSQ